jgi:hypothetical protein
MEYLLLSIRFYRYSSIPPIDLWYGGAHLMYILLLWVLGLLLLGVCFAYLSNTIQSDSPTICACQQ